MRLLVLFGLSACVLDPHRFERPAQMHLGAGARHFTAQPAAAQSGAPESFRTETPPTAMTSSHQAVMATLGFTMSGPAGTYFGGEAETGVLDTAGSNAAGGYGIFGFGHELGGLTLGGELAAGYRSIRYSVESDDYGKFVAEPRAHAQVWVGPQLTLGATAGITIAEQPVWMAGVYLGIHSHEHDTFGRK